MHIVLTRAEERKLRKAIRSATKVVALGTIVASFLLVGHIESHYKIEARVTELKGHTYTVEDVAGYEWKFTNDELFPTGTKVELKMFNGFTDSRFDDEIVKVTPVK